ncbi:N-acyl homoserine lactonase family protein [Edaphobacillus lindanitolerans]|uniref:Glyoxylase, beta-lactamase superfamily II n=1 Tax=Edaphobacillus lindanitolerans TaxID=550447 RepID=A0A1U7PT40_9BACI|nr:N-acyl homoserine lactonase family protein [Edaphobacillus lindanitolerans]SIT91213.1 Glyoxylase, beta-lactamase superfamily II [Edaphobacillus lindanitolerans]
MKDYSIWVLEYSYVPDYHKSGVIYGAHNEGYVKLPYCYVLIKGKGRTILVDVGFNNKEYGKVLADRFGVKNWQSPKVVLDEVGVKPEDVDTVFVTHAHFDHFGNIEDFPNATFYLQEREISKWMWAMSLPEQFGWLMGAMDPGDIIRGAELARDGRLVLIDGDREDVLPGIDLFAAFDTHTFGSQFVRVKNGETGTEDSWILAGDLVYVFDNAEGRDGDGVYVPVGLASGSQTNLLLATDKMMTLVDRDPTRVIPIHEQRLVERFPSRVSEKGLHIVEITLADGETSKVRQ